jgi:hypothetical protein
MDLAAREALDIAHDDIGDRDSPVTPGHSVADAVPDEIARPRAALGAFARSLGAPDALVDDVRLAVTEALTNAVMHAYHDGALGRVDARASADPAAGLMTSASAITASDIAAAPIAPAWDRASQSWPL